MPLKAWTQQCFASHLVLQCLRDGVVPGVVEVDLTPLYGHRTASSDLGGELHGVVHQQLPAQGTKEATARAFHSKIDWTITQTKLA